MLNALVFLRDVFISFVLMLSMAFATSGGAPYEAKNPEAATLVFTALADVHVETNNTISYTNFQNILKDVRANTSDNALVFLGDNTMNGQVLENMLFFGAVSAAVDSKNTFVAVGNHDVGNGEGDYDNLFTRFKFYNNLYLKNDIDKPYYYRTVNGYYFIFLSTEDLCVNEFVVSDEQLEWLRATLDIAKESEKPIFVFSHHPLSYVYNENSNLLYDILGEYDNVYHIHGHTHWDTCTYVENGVVCLNLPRVTDDGIGAVIEVYGSEVVIRERNFISSQWLNEFAFQ